MSNLQTYGNKGFMVINTYQEAVQFAESIANSALCPPGYVKRPHDILVCMQMGAELGLQPLQSLQNITVIRNRPTLWGDAMLAVCRQAHNFEYVTETFDEATMTAKCVAKRKGEPPVTQTFSEKDARTAGLWGKEGPWRSYPKRMLQMRARGFALRDAFPDLLRGIITREEALDIPPEDYEVVNDVSAKPAEQGPTQPLIDNQSISEAEVQELNKLLSETQSDVTKFCAMLNVEAIEKLTYQQLPYARRALEQKVALQKKKAAVEINKMLEGLDPVITELTLLPETVTEQ